jgi:hypothetical protein
VSNLVLNPDNITRSELKRLVSDIRRALTAPPADRACRECGRDIRDHEYTAACGMCWDRAKSRKRRGQCAGADLCRCFG